MSNALIVAGSLANIVVAVTAGAALYLAWSQIKLSRELSALDAYERYHEMCMEYPQYVDGSLDYKTLNATERSCYETFVLYTLMIDERIYSLFPDDDAWHYSIMDDIRSHKPFIGSDDFGHHLEGQGWTITPLIKRVLAE